MDWQDEQDGDFLPQQSGNPGDWFFFVGFEPGVMSLFDGFLG